MRMEQGKDQGGGWARYCGTLRKGREAMKRTVRHRARQAGRKETARSTQED
jgi:hypothetical protein